MQLLKNSKNKLKLFGRRGTAEMYLKQVSYVFFLMEIYLYIFIFLYLNI